MSEKSKQKTITWGEVGPDWQGVVPDFFAQCEETQVYAFGDTPSKALAALAQRLEEEGSR